DIVTPGTSAAGAQVSFTVTATDKDDPVKSIDCSPGSGSTFPIGTTTVACTATDSHGNTSLPKTFHVTVEDPARPVVAWTDPSPGPALLDSQPLEATATPSGTRTVVDVIFQYAAQPGPDNWITIAHDDTAPYRQSFDTTALSPGLYDLRA